MEPPAAAEATEGPKSTARRDLLLQIQASAQQQWKESKVFEVDAPAEGEEQPAKFFGNFPYPYMNGLLHLGHAFSLSKLEFASAYHRLCGRKVLFPQGFHCTGMPIKACADRLDRELSQFGNPPTFPEAEEEVEASSSAPAAAGAPPSTSDPTKFSGKRSKAAAKKGPGATQWQILQQSGIADEDIPAFRDTDHWLRYFPPLAIEDLQALGCGVDWRRSFITTDVNPFYDSFVRWQFWRLKKLGKVVKDKRYAVFSPLDGQPCADHDRASGEGVGPQEYTLVKMKALELTGKLSALSAHQGKVYLMAATLRPETMYGQTNCWALPDGQYGAYLGLDGEVYIMTKRAALNLSYQERTPVRGQPEGLLELTGQDLFGVPLSAPNCPHERIYVLPLLTILTNKGTGIVTSVPSDSPDDYIALLDLKKKPKLREKYGIKDEWVLPFEVIPIIDIPGFGDRSAQVVCEQLKIQSQNDATKLAEAKGMVYLKGFTDGVMQVGPYAGRKVSEAKPELRKDLINAGSALPYSEPEKPVKSRSGDDCVVALTDQWYLLYGEAEWQDLTRQALARLETYSDEARHSFEHCLGWLNQWACSRSFGLGTRLPWDEQYLIESLSDSTVYMAYYTVAHFLQGGDIFGATVGDVRPEDLTPEVWDFVFDLGEQPPNSAIAPDLLRRMRAEFMYWYPFDLRVSGKDLIQNHLSFALYNHTALWPKEKWPLSYRCNGHLLLNSDKMSKSTGNFKTLAQSIREYSADATRWALADAGDGMDDANFEETTANAAILRITKELAWTEENLAPGAGLREGPPNTLHDKVFENEINIAVHASRAAYDRLLFREALKVAGYDLANARDLYRFASGPDGLNRQLIERFVEVSTLLLAPITPHTSEHVWRVLLRRQGSALTAGFPEAPPADLKMQQANNFVEGLIPTLRKLIAKAEAPPKRKKGSDGPVPPALHVVHADLFVAERFAGWQDATLGQLRPKFNAEARTFAPDTTASLMAALKGSGSTYGMTDKALMGSALPFAKAKMDEAVLAGEQALQSALPFDERALLTANLPYLLRALKLDSLQVHSASDEAAVAAALEASGGGPLPQAGVATAAHPGSPVAVFRTGPQA